MTNKQEINSVSIHQSGVTLMEVLVAMFISVLVIMAAYSVYLVSTRSYNRGEKVTDITQNGRIAMDRMVRDIRQTIEIVTDSFPQQSPGSASIEFQDGHVTDPIGDTQYIKYVLNGSDLHKQRFYYYCAGNQDAHVHKLYDCDPDPNHFTATNLYTIADDITAQKISNLEFYGQRLITLNFNVVDGNETYPFTTAVFGRNIP